MKSTNILDGLTILRFAHAFESGAGVEQYIDDLDRSLLARNKISILRMYLSESGDDETERTEKIGQGTLVKIPLITKRTARQINAEGQKKEDPHGTLLKKLLRDWIVYNPLLYRFLFRNMLKRLPPKSGLIEAVNARQVAEKIFKHYKIDLLVMHYVGGVDSESVIKAAKLRNVPYIFLNHFSNDRLDNISIREQLNDAAGIAGVSSVDVPARLKSRFFNLSDGIDTEIFKTEHARPINHNLGNNIIIMPARIVVTKGQGDLIKACATLKNQGVHFKLVLAGRSDSLQFEEQLKNQVSELGIKDDVLFVGQLNKEQLRDWYGIAAILAFPTYHHEGLPRILMEAQSMQVPPVAYNVGGMSEGIRHELTGYLIPKGNIKLFTEKLKELLIDENKRGKMGKEARIFIQKYFSLRALAKRHEKYYMQIIRDTIRNQ